MIKWGEREWKEQTEIGLSVAEMNYFAGKQVIVNNNNRLPKDLTMVKLR